MTKQLQHSLASCFVSVSSLVMYNMDDYLPSLLLRFVVAALLHTYIADMNMTLLDGTRRIQAKGIFVSV